MLPGIPAIGQTLVKWLLTPEHQMILLTRSSTTYLSSRCLLRSITSASSLRKPVPIILVLACLKAEWHVSSSPVNHQTGIFGSGHQWWWPSWLDPPRLMTLFESQTW